MKHITFYFDVISPYAYLAFEQLPEALQGISYEVTYKPVLFAGLLKHHGQLGPAEIPSKREWTYRQVQWLAHELGVELQLPAAHPFNPLALMRLAVCTSLSGLPNRYVTEKLFHHVWLGGLDAADEQRFEILKTELKLVAEPNTIEVKKLLKMHTDSAIQQDVFGIPTLEVDGKLFFGLDSLPMLAAYLNGDSWYSNSAWNDVRKIPIGTARKN
ncbi:MAG: 2-hydroxychromene-2-carboxylate isomerase [Burkholderiaceae bacterium]